jgi:hypothetical protein
LEAKLEDRINEQMARFNSKNEVVDAITGQTVRLLPDAVVPDVTK